MNNLSIILIFVTVIFVLITIACMWESYCIKDDKRSVCERKGHNYEGRYSEGRPASADHIECSVHAMNEFIKNSKPRIYEYDICTRCGKVSKEK